MGSVTGDLVFKLIFSDSRSKKMLIHLLNSIIVGAKGNPIVDLQIRKTELTPEFLGGKEVRLDILAEASDKRRINVEIQRQSQSYFVKRSLFHWAEIYFQQLPKGGKFLELCQTVCINILEESIFKDDRFWHKYHLREDETYELLTDVEEIHFLELAKMKEYQKDNPVTWWLEYIKNPHSEVVDKIGEFEPIIKEAVKMFDIVSSDPATQELIRIRNDGEHDYNSAMWEAEMKGEARGEARGKTEGRLEGIKEAAKKMLLAGIDSSIITSSLGLSTSEIQSLSRS
ncbi:transposase [Alphaproteobacteria bacterium]|nr:transposase [Alphaproteobacteria bacterium]